MKAKSRSSNHDNSLENPFEPDLNPDSPSIESRTNPEFELESKLNKADPEIETGSGIGDKLRGIEDDSFVSMDTARKSGLGLMIGSTLYINEHFRNVEDAIEESLPSDISVEGYLPEEANELPEKIESLANKGLEEINNLEDLPELSEYSMEDSPVNLEYIDTKKYDSALEEMLTEADPVIDEVVDKLNTDVESWEEMGIDTSENLVDQITPETVTDSILYSFDNLTHLAITGTMSNYVAGTMDKFTDRESLIAAAGMSTALAFAVAKEGFYEGGAGLQFDPHNIDVQGDWISDTIGAAWGTTSYLKNKSKEEAYEGDVDTGLTGSAARKMGRAYEKAKFLAETNLPARLAKYEPENKLNYQESDVGLVKYDLDQKIEAN